MIVEGWASTAHLDHYRHIVVPGAFSESIREKGLNGSKGIKLLWQHKADKPLGHIITLEQRAQGLWMEAEIEEGISYGKDVAVASKSIGGLNFSVGFFMIDADYLEDSQGRGYLNIVKGELQEISVVVFPGNENATMTAHEKLSPLEQLTANVTKMRLALADPQTKGLPTLSKHLAELKRILS